MVRNREELCNKLAFAKPAVPETATIRLQRWNLMDTVPDWLLPKLNSAFVTKHPVSKKYIGFLITNTDEVLVVGDNTNGILALNPTKVKSADRPLYNGELSGKGIIDIINFGASSTIAARTIDGKILTWGDNASGLHGINHANAASGCSHVRGVLKEERVVQHCCGASDVLCLTSSGKIIGWGSVVFPNINAAHYNPFAVKGLPPSSIDWIGATSSGFFALTETGEVYTWGLECHGRTDNDAWTPKKIELSPEVRVKKVSCGLHHVLVLTTENQLYTWGHNSSGQVGNGSEDGTEVKTPKLIQLDQDYSVEDILAVTSADVSFCKTSNGTIYEWGLISGKNVFVPTATKYKNFDYGLMANDLGMNSKWTNSPSPAEVETKYKAVIKGSNQKKFMFNVGGANVEALEYAACRSPVMRQMLETDWKDLVAEEKPVELEDIPDWPLFLSLMMFLHTDEVMASDGDLLDLVRLANIYEVFELGRKSAKKLQALITENNAVDIYVVARKCGAAGLVLVALDTISGFFWDICAKSGKKYDPVLLGQLVSDLQDLKFGPKLKRPCD